MSPKKLVIIACLILVVIGVPTAYFLSTMKQHDLIGIVDGQKIYETDLTKEERQTLFDADNQVYLTAQNILAKRYFEKIVADYKKQHNIEDDLTAQQAYIRENIKIPEAQIKEFINQNRENPQLKGKTYEEQKNLVEPYLMQQEIQTFFVNLIQKGSLEGKLNVLYIKKPNITESKIQINVTDPTIGLPNAPITMVEFADFECPYCNSVFPTVKALLKKYDGKIFFVFKNYPLTQIHAQALNAAIAAKCAQEQNKYWEMHDKLFENYRRLSDNLYTELANELKLNKAEFKTCQETPAIRAQIMSDIEYGESLGLKATPAFYINGKLITGAQPISVFEHAIDEELAKH